MMKNRAEVADRLAMSVIEKAQGEIDSSIENVRNILAFEIHNALCEYDCLDCEVIGLLELRAVDDIMAEVKRGINSQLLGEVRCVMSYLLGSD